MTQNMVCKPENLVFTPSQGLEGSVLDSCEFRGFVPNFGLYIPLSGLRWGIHPPNPQAWGGPAMQYSACRRNYGEQLKDPATKRPCNNERVNREKSAKPAAWIGSPNPTRRSTSLICGDRHHRPPASLACRDNSGSSSLQRSWTAITAGTPPVLSWRCGIPPRSIPCNALRSRRPPCQPFPCLGWRW